MKLARRMGQFSEYVFSALDRRIGEVEEKSGRKVLNLGMGSPDIQPSTVYIKKLQEFVSAPEAHRYPGYGATPEFASALIQWHKNRFGVVIRQDELLPLLGAKDAIAHLPIALLDPGDEVLIPDPGYSGFSGPTIMAGGIPVYYDLTQENSFLPDIAELERKVSKKTKYIWVNFPSNPTGQVATVKELTALVSFARSHNIWLIYDNAYSEITFDGVVAPSILQISGASDIAVEIGSFSKTFSFAGYRMGWIAGNKQIVQALGKVKTQMDSGLSLPLQQLGAFALTHTDTVWHRQMIATYASRRNSIVKALANLELQTTLPKGSLYLWAKIPESYDDSNTFCTHLLEQKQIVLTPGTAFGKNGKNFVRVSICTNIDKISEYIHI